MICEHCAAGGDLTREPAPTLEATLQLAADEHARCRGGTFCPCQHVPPSLPELAARRSAMPRGGLARIAHGLHGWPVDAGPHTGDPGACVLESCC